MLLLFWNYLKRQGPIVAIMQVITVEEPVVITEVLTEAI